MRVKDIPADFGKLTLNSFLFFPFFKGAELILFHKRLLMLHLVHSAAVFLVTLSDMTLSYDITF